MKFVSIPTAKSARVASKRLLPADASLSSTPSTTPADQVTLIDIAIPCQPPSPTVPTRDALASTAAASHAFAPVLLIIELENWSWSP